MKKVKKTDLKRLIASYYCNYARQVPISDIINGSCGISIDVNTVCITITDHNYYENEENWKADLQLFSEKIKEITLGNVMVIEMNCQVISGLSASLYTTWLNIANAYEVVE